MFVLQGGGFLEGVFHDAEDGAHEDAGKGDQEKDDDEEVLVPQNAVDVKMNEDTLCREEKAFDETAPRQPSQAGDIGGDKDEVLADIEKEAQEASRREKSEDQFAVGKEDDRQGGGNGMIGEPEAGIIVDGDGNGDHHGDTEAGDGDGDGDGKAFVDFQHGGVLSWGDWFCVFRISQILMNVNRFLLFFDK